jgi:hypothetical protein
MVTAQAIVERGMLDSLATGLTRVRYAIEAQIGAGNAKWLLAVVVVGLLFWAFRPRR